MKISNQVLKNVKILWNYHRLDDELIKTDLIFCLGSLDIRSAVRASELFLDGYSNKILFSGGIAHSNDFLKTTWEQPEAVVFAEVALGLGVPKENILLETEATNTGENIKKGYEIINKTGIELKSMILVQKPYMGRRTYATFKKQWPGDDIEIIITSPQISFEDYFNVDDVEKEKIINIMVGDLQRIKEYPRMGYQIYQEIPTEVLDAFYFLVDAGFNSHLIKQ